MRANEDLDAAFTDALPLTSTRLPKQRRRKPAPGKRDLIRRKARMTHGISAGWYTHQPTFTFFWRISMKNHPFGSNHPKAKLNETSVHVADILSSCGWTAIEISKVFGIGDASMSSLLRRVNWRHVLRFNTPEKLIQIFGPDRTLERLLKMTDKNCRLHPRFTDYAVSDDGSVFSRSKSKGNPSGEWRQIKPNAQKTGHLRVAIFQSGDKTKTRSVHCLVLEAFVCPCPPGTECRHLDGNPQNNSLSNLSWGTPKENSLDRVAHGRQRRGSLAKQSKLNEAQIPPIDVLSANGWTPREIAPFFHVDRVTIRDLLRRRTWKHVPNQGRQLLAQVSLALTQQQTTEEPYPLFGLLVETIRRNRLAEGEHS